MSETYVIGPKEYEFEYHGRSLRVATNVKCYAYATVPPHLEEKYAQLLEEDPQLAERLQQDAWDTICEDWWEWAQEYATEQGVGRIYSSGRSGGWLILDDWSPSRISETLYDAQHACIHCDRSLDEHAANGKCLFESTMFEGSAETTGQLDALVQFLETCQKCAQDQGSAIQERFEEDLKDAWESLFGEATPMLSTGG